MNEPYMLIEKAAQIVRDADAIIIAAGAGMGVDSGLPDFRGNRGFWKAYPALASAGIDFQAAASANAFIRDPARAWGFYGHRLALYRRYCSPHGFFLVTEVGPYQAAWLQRFYQQCRWSVRACWLRA